MWGEEEEEQRKTASYTSKVGDSDKHSSNQPWSRLGFFQLLCYTVFHQRRHEALSLIKRFGPSSISVRTSLSLQQQRIKDEPEEEKGGKKTGEQGVGARIQRPDNSRGRQTDKGT